MLNAILRLLGSPEMSESLSQNGRLKVKDFDWEVVKQQWFEVIGR
jgi:glycosyltransferase involved in cell wall biosynthesis